jgi:hypothetical protein
MACNTLLDKAASDPMEIRMISASMTTYSTVAAPFRFSLEIVRINLLIAD